MNIMQARRLLSVVMVLSILTLPTVESDELGDGAIVLEEVIVTAARREQNLQDVASSVQAFNGAELDRLGADGFEDYILTVPGVSLNDQGNGSVRIALRGVSNTGGTENAGLGGSTVSTTGLYLNDVAVQNTASLPDLGLYDLNRIEVLKGPQGTLYGEGAMGGAIKLIMNSPSTEGFEGKMDADLSATENGGFNYNLRGVANIPVVPDKVALRIVGSYKNEEGFIDNIVSGDKDVNSSEAYSIRGTLIAQLTDNLSAELLAMHDVLDQDEFDQVNKTLGDLKIDATESRFNELDTTLIGLTLEYDLGFAELSSISSYYSSERELIQKFLFAEAVFGGLAPVTQEPVLTGVDLETVAQEFRLVSNGDNRLDWAFGLFYRSKEQDGFFDLFVAPDELPAVNAATIAAGLTPLPDNGTFFFNPVSDTYEQYAVYGEANFELIDKLEVTFGLRWFDEEVTYDDSFVTFGIVNSFLPSFDGPEIKIKEDDIIPKVGISYKISEDHMVYALASKGFRSSAINLNNALGVGGLGATSDNIWNYELGVKTNWLDGRLVVNSTLYFIDWSDIQGTQIEFSNITQSLLSFTANGGDAEILGFESEIAAIPNDNFTLGLTFGYSDNELTKSADGVNAIEGAPIPNAPEWTFSGFGEYRFPFSGFAGAEGIIRFDAKYIDSRVIRLITTSDDGGAVDSYALGNLRIGLEAEKWSLAFNINNLWDERAEYSRGLAALSPQNAARVSIARPRTFGVSFSRAL